MAKPKSTMRTCGKCGESGHSIRTCLQMKAVSAARLQAATKWEAAMKSADSKVVEMPLKKQA